MSSPEQIDANQRNGLLSQGPKTSEGKAASARNGLFGRRLVYGGGSNQ
jgi:hypothetical protein